MYANEFIITSARRGKNIPVISIALHLVVIASKRHWRYLRYRPKESTKGWASGLQPEPGTKQIDCSMQSQRRSVIFGKDGHLAKKDQADWRSIH